MEARYELTQRLDNSRYIVRVFDEGGCLVLESQYREMKPMCLNEITWMRGSGHKESLYERCENDDGFWFVLHATDAHILGTSPRFDTAAERDEAIVKARGVLSEAKLVDTTPDLDFDTRIHDVLARHARDVVAGRVSA